MIILNFYNIIALIDNIASNRVIEKCGFKNSGEIKIEDEIYNNYNLSKNDWMD